MAVEIALTKTQAAKAKGAFLKAEESAKLGKFGAVFAQVLPAGEFAAVRFEFIEEHYTKQIQAILQQRTKDRQEGKTP